jgi:radical SAM protein with 4Fe4S-binding SPASM domain
LSPCVRMLTSARPEVGSSSIARAASRPPSCPPPTAVSNIFLHVTNACNLRCTYCYASAGLPVRNELTTAEILRLWLDIVAIRPRKVVFTGGEPLLRADILTLLEGLRDADPEHEIRRCLNTNGWLITEPVALQLVGLVDEVRVSIDALAGRNDALRGAGSFEAAVSALDACRLVGFEPRAMVTITPTSLPDLQELICFLVSRKITRISFNLVRPIGRAGRSEGWGVDLRAAQAAVRQALEKCLPGQPMPLQTPPGAIQVDCGLGHFVNIMANGDVYPCYVLTHPRFFVGNVRGESCTAITRRIQAIGESVSSGFASSTQSHRSSPTCLDECPGITIVKTAAALSKVASSAMREARDA